MKRSSIDSTITWTSCSRGRGPAGGTTIPIIQWCNGIVFQVVPFNLNSEKVIEEQLEGVIHYSTVSYALKERYEPEVRMGLGTLRMVNASANSNFIALADMLKQRSKFKT
jgi:hypothetical protein